MPDLLAYGISGFLAWLMALAAWHKLAQPVVYRGIMAGYVGGAAIPAPLVRLIAAVEALIALLLVLPATRAPALWMAAGLLLAYAGLMTVQLLQGRSDLRCGCAGPDAATTVSPALVARNLLCAALAVAALPVASTTPGGLHALAAALPVAGFLALTYLCCEQLISNAQRMAKGF
jgi:hypothetical protein